MKLGIIMPLWLNDVPTLWESTRRAVQSLAVNSCRAKLYLVPQRLHGGNDALWDCIRGAPLSIGATILQLNPERSVAGAWNAGIAVAQKHGGCDRFLITANDCYWHLGAVDALLAFEREMNDPNLLTWSGAAHDLDAPDAACDYTGVMLTAATLERVGQFDAHFKPAYFEDNDYAIRAALAGGICRRVPGARFDHAGSLTIHSCPEAAHHVRHWWDRNRVRFAAKWGTYDPPPDAAAAREQCYRTPWNDPALTIRDWDRE